MKHLILAFLFFAVASQAQRITTYSSKGGISKVESEYQAVDVSVKDWEYKRADRFFPLNAAPAPSLIDLQSKLSVEITGTIAQAEAELDALEISTGSKKAQFRGRDVTSEIRTLRSNAASSQSLLALRDQVAELSDLVEYLLERVTHLETQNLLRE